MCRSIDFPVVIYFQEKAVKVAEQLQVKMLNWKGEDLGAYSKSSIFSPLRYIERVYEHQQNVSISPMPVCERHKAEPGFLEGTNFDSH